MAKVRKYDQATGNEVLVEVKVGDTVGFKSDYEQYGRVTRIDGDRLTIENDNGFGGEYLRYATKTTESARDCWID